MANTEPNGTSDAGESGLGSFAKAMYNIWITERPAQFAAALAYYAIFSFVPVIYIAFTLTDFVVGRLSVSAQVYALVTELLGQEIALAVQEAVANLAERTESGTTLTTIIGFLALAFAASLLFFQLQHTLNTLWNVPPPKRGQTRAYVRNRLLAFAMVLGVALFLILAALVNLVIPLIGSRLPWGGFASIGSNLLFMALTALSFALIYKVLPNATVGWREVWLGAGVAAVLVVVGTGLLGLYFGAAKFSTALEAAGAVAVLLMTFYYLGQIFVFGALITRVYANMFGSGIVPRSNQEPVDQGAPRGPLA